MSLLRKDTQCYYMFKRIIDDIITFDDYTQKQYKCQLLINFFDCSYKEQLDCIQTARYCLRHNMTPGKPVHVLIENAEKYAESIKQFKDLFDKMMECLKENNNTKLNDAYNALTIPKETHFLNNEIFKDAVCTYFDWIKETI